MLFSLKKLKQRMKVSLFLFWSGSDVHDETEGFWRALCQLKKSFRSEKSKRKELLDCMKKVSAPSENWFDLQNTKRNEFVLVTRPAPILPWPAVRPWGSGRWNSSTLSYATIEKPAEQRETLLYFILDILHLIQKLIGLQTYEKLL